MRVCLSQLRFSLGVIGQAVKAFGVSFYLNAVFVIYLLVTHRAKAGFAFCEIPKNIHL